MGGESGYSTHSLPFTLTTLQDGCADLATGIQVVPCHFDLEWVTFMTTV